MWLVQLCVIVCVAWCQVTRVYEEYTRSDEGLRTVCWLLGGEEDGFVASALRNIPEEALKEDAALWAKGAAEFRAAFRECVSKPKPGCPHGVFPDPDARKTELSDLTLIVPLGQDDVKHTFVLLESLAVSDSYPAEILFVTNLVMDSEANDDVETRVSKIHVPCAYALSHLTKDQLTNFKLLNQILQSELYSTIAGRVRWAIHSGRRGASVNRWMGSIFANTTYVAYHDSDDVMFPDSLRLRYKYMTSGAAATADILLTSGEWIFFGAEEGAKGVPNRTESIGMLMDLYGKHFCLPNDVLSVERLHGEAFNRENDETLHRSFGGLAYQSYMPGSLTGFPNFQYSLTCDGGGGASPEYLRVIGEIENDPSVFDVRNKVPRSELDPFKRLREEQDLRFLRTVCSNEYTYQEQWVDRCVNGWAIANTHAVRAVPPTTLPFGEDSLVNFIHFGLGHHIICDEAHRAGIYIRNGNTSVLES